MSRALAFALSLACVAGCAATDPCAGVQGICLAATVKGDVGPLDALAFSSDALPGKTATTMPMGGGTFSLPVKVAVVFPQGGTMNVRVDGLHAGAILGSSGPVKVTLPATGELSQTFTLVGSGPGDGGVDLRMPDLPAVDSSVDFEPPLDLYGLDLAGAVVFDPLEVDFPLTPRNTFSKPIPVTVTNNTSVNVDFSSVTLSGDTNQFTFDPSTTCSPGTPIPPGGSCVAQCVFAPKAVGPWSETITASVNGVASSITLKGTGVPAWTVESVNDPMASLTSVWGESAGQVWITSSGGSTGASIWRSGGTPGAWNPIAYLGGVFAFTGANQQHWAGGQGGVYDDLNATMMWMFEPNYPSSAVPVRGLYAEPMQPGVVIAAAGPAGVYQRDPTGGWGAVPLVGVPNQNYFAVTGDAKSSTWAAVGVMGQLVYQDPSGNMLSAPTNTQANLFGVWMQPGTQTTWAVGDSVGSLTMQPAIIRCNLMPPPAQCTSEQPPPGVTGNLQSIFGRADPNTGAITSLWAVGALGSQVFASDGSGAWTAMDIPTNTPLLSVFVAPDDGEVYAVGGNTILHLY